MAFEAITTQEQLDSIIGERLKRERETVEKKLRESIEKEYLEKLIPRSLQDMRNHLRRHRPD